MSLAKILENTSDFKSRKRVGRGIGSGKGKTCGRGHKGQKSRSGVAIKGFEGGQMPIHRRLPKRGFNNRSTDKPAILNLDDIQKLVDAKQIDVTKEVNDEILLKASGQKASGVKILSRGELKAKLNIKLSKVSKVAEDKIKKAGGSVA
jgi:large subunit ribosomal protein L15